MPHHSGLAQRKTRENTDDVKLYQPVDVRFETGDQCGGGSSEQEDPVAERELVTAVTELTR